MAHLKQFFKSSIKRVVLSCGVLYFFMPGSPALQAEILPFFNPGAIQEKSAINVSMQAFIASDPVSVHSFFNDWDGRYTPEKKDNIVMEELRIDVSLLLDEQYAIGYFFSRNLLGVANRDFVDFYHAIKNDKKFNNKKQYAISLEMKGIDQHGLLLSRHVNLINNKEHAFTVGGSVFLSYATDIQDGQLVGESTIDVDQTYNASGSVDYYYMNNLLYDINVEKTYGLGYGFHAGLDYVNKVYNFKISFLANDIFSRSYWKNIPFSYVDIETENQIINNRGHIEYNPTISGREIYRNYTQKVLPKCQAKITKHFHYDIDATLGVEKRSIVTMPYVKAVKTMSDGRKIGLLYENRFKSMGISLEEKNYYISFLTDGLTNVSAASLSGKYLYHF